MHAHTPVFNFILIVFVLETGFNSKLFLNDDNCMFPVNKLVGIRKY